MYFPRSFFLAVLSAPLLAFAAENQFTNTAYLATAGKSLQLNWKPTTAGKVSLYLRYGNPGDLVTVQTIVTGIDNSGSYKYNIPADTPQGGAYAIEIVSDSNPSQTNYTPQFTLTSTNTASPTGVGSSSSASMSTAASTESPSAFPLPSGVTIDTSFHPSTGSSATLTASDSSSSASMSMSSDSSSSMTMTGSSSMMTSTTTGSSSASASSAASSSQAGLVASQSSTSSGGVARATAMAGMLGVVALGALAL